MNKDAISLQKERILYETQRTPMKANALVVGAAQGSMGLMLSIFVLQGDVSWYPYYRSPTMVSSLGSKLRDRLEA